MPGWIKYAWILVAFFFWQCSTPPPAKKETLHLSIAPAIDRSDSLNQAIIAALKLFLASKNDSLEYNAHWSAADFDTFPQPYLDLYEVEKSQFGAHFYQPILMSISDAKISGSKIIKLAFAGYHAETDEHMIRLIYRIMAREENGKIVFSRYLPYATRHWKTMDAGSIRYFISPKKQVNSTEIAAQKKDIEQLCRFFACDPVSLRYYSCADPEELFEIRGFDYHPMMKGQQSGGLIEAGQLVFSGNHSEIYTHEIVHIYTGQLFPHLPKLIDEGLATRLAGSGHYDYAWHRAQFREFLEAQPDFEIGAHLDPYEELYIHKETPIPYMIGALICERLFRMQDKTEALQSLGSSQALWPLLNTLGLNSENINAELRSEIRRPIPPAWPE